jgi:hypothetical protein
LYFGGIISPSGSIYSDGWFVLNVKVGGTSLDTVAFFDGFFSAIFFAGLIGISSMSKIY